MLARDDRNTPVDWVARAAALVPMIEAASDRIEAERRIVPEVIAALHEAGLFRMLLPASFGGGAADVIAFNQVIETIATADASYRVVPGAAGGEHADGELSRPKSRARDFCRPRRRRRLGPARGRQSGRRRRRLYRQRPVALCQRQRALPVARRPLHGVRGGRQAALGQAGPPGAAHHAVPQGQGDILRHLARDRAVRHRQQCLRGDRAVRAGGLLVLARSARRPPRRRSARQHSAA